MEAILWKNQAASFHWLQLISTKSSCKRYITCKEIIILYSIRLISKIKLEIYNIYLQQILA